MNSLQFTLFNNQGAESGSSDIAWIPTAELSPHPDNPRLIYREDIIGAIAQSIKEHGFQPCYALLVRPHGDGYQVVSGHTRLKAAQSVGVDKLPCWIQQMTDEEAFMELVLANNQGELSPLEYGMHILKYVELSEGGRGKKGGLSEYARVVGKTHGYFSQCQQGAKVVTQVTGFEYSSLLNKTKHLAAIHSTPPRYWQQLTELLIENEWSVKQAEGICNAVKSIEIPDYLQFWLNPDKAIKDTIAEALRGEEPRTPRDIFNWVEAVNKQIEKLPERRKVVLVNRTDDSEVEEIDYLNLKQEFLNRLPGISQGDKKPSAKRIEALASDVLKWVEGLDKVHEEWLASKADEAEKAKAREEAYRADLERRNRYSPEGINAPIQSLTTATLGDNFDAVITDIPYLVSAGTTTVRSGKEVSVSKNFDDTLNPSEYVGLLYEVLAPGGYFVTTATVHVLSDLLTSALAAGFQLRQKLVWFKRNSPPLLAADRFKPDYEDILVFIKPGATPYFGYDDIKLDGDKQRGAVIDIPQCSGKERGAGHDTQKPQQLYEILVKAYCPPDGHVLEPFAGSGTTPAACKRLGRICTWVEQDAGFFATASDRIDATPYHWEG